MRYKNKRTNDIVEVIDNKAAGMCSILRGTTLVIYKSNDYNFHFVMKQREFYDKYEKVDTYFNKKKH